jgi:hypothetical protein
MLTVVITNVRTSQEDVPPMAFLEKSIPYVYELLNKMKQLSVEDPCTGVLNEPSQSVIIYTV